MSLVISFFYFSDIALHSLSFKVSIKMLNGFMIQKKSAINHEWKKHGGLEGKDEQVLIPTFILTIWSQFKKHEFHIGLNHTHQQLQAVHDSNASNWTGWLEWISTTIFTYPESPWLLSVKLSVISCNMQRFINATNQRLMNTKQVEVIFKCLDLYLCMHNKLFHLVLISYGQFWQTCWSLWSCCH